MKKFSIFPILLAVIFPLTLFVSTSYAYTFSDDFATGINSSYWTVTSNGNPNSTVSWSTGEVIMTQGAGSYSGAGVHLVFNLPTTGITGDFDTTVDFTLINWSADNLERLGIQTPFGAVERISDNGFGGESYTTDFSHIITILPASGNSGELRFDRTGNTLYGYYWNGTDWALISSSIVSGSLTVLELSIWPSNNGATAGTEVAFDNFYLNYNSTSVPEPTTMLLLGLGLVGLAGVRRKFQK